MKICDHLWILRIQIVPIIVTQGTPQLYPFNHKSPLGLDKIEIELIPLGSTLGDHGRFSTKIV